MKKIFREKYTVINYSIPILLTAICFFWRFYFITDRDICLDEPYTIYNAQKSIPEIIMLTVNGEPNPPLFMLLIHFGIKIFGISQYLRIIPLLFSSLTLIFIYKCALKISTAYGALISSFLFMFSTLHFYFALEVRTYSLLSFLTAVVYYLYILLITGESKKWVTYCIVLTNIGIVTSHYFGWFVVFNQFVLLLFYFKDKQIYKKIFRTLFASMIICTPAVFLVLKQFLVSSKGTWVSPPWEGQYWYYLDLFFNDWRTTAYIEFSIVAGLCYYFYNVYKQKSFILNSFKIITVLFLWFAVPFFTMYFISFKVPMFLDRYILFNSIPLYLFTGAAIGKLFNTKWYFAIIALLCVLLSSFEHLKINDRDFYYREVHNGVSLSSKFTDAKSLLFIYPACLNLEFAYYYDNRIFKNITDQKQLFNLKNIYPISKAEEAVEIIKKSDTVSKIIFYETGFISDTVFAGHQLHSKFELIDSAFFPQCIYIRVYKKK